MKVDQLLSTLETLPYHERVRHMVEMGKQSLTNETLRQLLTTLSKGEMYQRMLALQACYGSRDGDAVLHALSDPSRTIRQMARRMVAYLCDDDQVQAAFASLLDADLGTLLTLLQKQRRQTPIDTYLEKQSANDPAAWVRRIGFGSAALVKPVIENVLMQGHSWEGQWLAARHPVLTVEALHLLAERATQMDQRLLWIANATLPILSDLVPAQAVEAVKALARHLPISQLDVQGLAQRRPVELADFLLTLQERPPSRGIFAGADCGARRSGLFERKLVLQMGSKT